ncbi:uncharacterized protein BDR25DRAFT_275721 [Lindgomyces ingoldianus]|uniref:Uncharacterized protein n=1 Tax=Lindgomyces ingoldianus TaxID=673940 RepID=A0ACB6RFF7_9PLEO|nr:uncharacterized protein BDR25DRAFT_275721 [Lindgomyces ingoldianus]KAF2478038.1 hypothetical protein BDR25DRAFT_275721 [Lindgomyces ingoldianus]
MSDVTELRCWPSGPFAISWSPDGIIALSSDEAIELLFPVIEAPGELEPDLIQWRHIPIQVSWFTKDELPVKDPAPLQTFSIGEEISQSLPLRISWSPPGLAKHRRCALAVLTSNLILSIWASHSKPQELAGWDRQLIINDALEKYFLDLPQEGRGLIMSEIEEKARLRKRIRAYSWAPCMDSASSTGQVGTQLSWGHYMIAVSNDDNDIILVSIRSPTSTFGQKEEWKAEVFGHFPLLCSPQSIIPDPGIFDEYLLEQRHICHLSWSPWVAHEDGLHSVLAYATNTDVRARVISYTQNGTSVGQDVVYPEIELRYSGPLEFSPKIGAGDTLMLSVFTASELICLTISAEDGSILSRATHDLDGRWDSISGVTFDVRPPNSSIVHFSSIIGTTRYPTAAVEVSPAGLSATSEPYWRTQIHENQVYFSANHDLGGNANAKTWGLSSSPLGDFVACCFTLHPTDMIEYITPSERRSTIAVSNMSGNGSELSFPARNISAEAVLFTIKKWWENNVENEEEVEEAKTAILEKLLQMHSPRRTTLQNSTSKAVIPVPGLTATEAALLTQFKQRAFLNTNTIKDRYQILISTAYPSSSSTSTMTTSTMTTSTMPTSISIAKTMIAHRLAKELQRLPPAISQTSDFSTQILTSSQHVIQLVLTLSSVDTAFPPSTSTPPIERCDFCDADLRMEDLESAQCANGHQFVRCGLTFLAIQAPGISKYCGICSQPYFSDEFVWEQEIASAASTPVSGRVRLEMNDMEVEMEMEQGAETLAEIREGDLRGNGGANKQKGSILPSMTLARLLFWACDACIYCGGKFVG